MDNLLVTVIGNPNSGKTHTWKTLFRKSVKTGKHPRTLYLDDPTSVVNPECVEVFLISGSPKERKIPIEEIISGVPKIVLCSLQYHTSEFESLEWFRKHDYAIFAHWLNPGYHDDGIQNDTINFETKVLAANGQFFIRSGKSDAHDRVGELREYIRDWAQQRDLIVYDRAY